MDLATLCAADTSAFIRWRREFVCLRLRDEQERLSHLAIGLQLLLTRDDIHEWVVGMWMWVAVIGAKFVLRASTEDR